ncbi:MAG: hypothetical protein D6757_07255 [Alphaproteobacteria bacterium]|nr:MAG: hypothetical protein D6757_07255 [Alphaproteobacteria bacterium]
MGRKMKSGKKTTPKTTVKKGRARTSAKKPGGGHRLLIFLAYLLFTLLLLFFPPIAAMIVLGLAPALVVLAFDHGAFKRPRLITLASFNFAGLFPFLLQLWHSHDTVSDFFRMISSIYTWGIIYGAAAFGAGLLWVGPALAAIILQAINQDRIKQIEKRQKALVREWGADITDTIEPREGMGARSS